MDNALLDIRYSLRGLRRAPTYALGVALTIGLGLGVLCSAFTLVNAYLLRPIDVAGAEALFRLDWDTTTRRSHGLTMGDVVALQLSLVGQAGIVASQQATVMDDGRAAGAVLVTGDYFGLIAPHMILGRGLLPSDVDSARGGSPSVVLSEREWRARHGADPAVVGRLITIGRTRFEVVGVMAAASTLRGEEASSFWSPLSAAAALGLPDPVGNPETPVLSAIARGRTGDAAPVRVAFDTWLRSRFPAGSDDQPVAVNVESLATRLPLTGPTLTLFTLIVAAFALILLIACANVTNLMLARALARQQQVAVRMSLGARRIDVLRQQIIESLLLAVPAAGVGLVITAAVARMFPSLILATFPPNVVPVDAILVPLEIDARILAMMAVGAVGAAVAVSIAPAGRMLRTDVARMSRGEASFDGRRSRLRTALVAAQVAASVLFLVGAAMLLLDSRRIADVDSGMRYERVVGVPVNAGLRPAVVRRLSADPEVDAIAVAWHPPLVGGRLAQLRVRTAGTGIATVAGFTVVSPEYFRVFGLRIVQGRGFTDGEARENAPVALVSAATARVLWPNAAAVGQMLDIGEPIARSGRRAPGHTRVRVIGVVADATNGTLPDGRDTTCIYFVTRPEADGEMAVLVRGRTSTGALRSAVTAAVNDVAPNTPVQTYTLTEIVGTLTWVFGAFSMTAAVLGGIGLVLACAGTYAVVSFLVTLRAREFGVRMALGAQASRLVADVLREQARTIGLGIVIGVAVATAFARLFSAVVPAIPSFDAFSYLAGTAAVAVATLVAALVPSARAARTDPAQVLRWD